ncbi:dolichyldiphosphatase [Angomonas deanei]|nr:dolichyldiphosphatase [Angomonas deanei]|eukprot:EPY38792.1 dolichyldiphosphatase [Angomonas deanei]
MTRTVWRQLCFAVDESCSAVVSLTVIGCNLFYLWQAPHSVVVPCFTAGCCVTAATGKVLKRVINQSRPAGAPKLSPGMPSNHAISLTFLALCTAYGLSPSFHPDRNPQLLQAGQLGVLGYAACGTGLRVYCGHHTWPQVLAGGALGLGSAALCLAANYAGYEGGNSGGRVDDLPTEWKQILQVGCVITGVLAFTSILRGSPLVERLMRKKPTKNTNA